MFRQVGKEVGFYKGRYSGPPNIARLSGGIGMVAAMLILMSCCCCGFI